MPPIRPGNKQKNSEELVVPTRVTFADPVVQPAAANPVQQTDATPPTSADAPKQRKRWDNATHKPVTQARFHEFEVPITVNTDPSYSDVISLIPSYHVLTLSSSTQITAPIGFCLMHSEGKITQADLLELRNLLMASKMNTSQKCPINTQTVSLYAVCANFVNPVICNRPRN